MTRMTQSEKLQRARRLRDLAVELMAHGGKLVPAKRLDQTIEVMAYEGERIAILYNTPRVDLRFPDAPDHVNPKSFMVDVWYDNKKRLSIQWDHDGELDILTYKSGDWEDAMTTEHDAKLRSAQPQI